MTLGITVAMRYGGASTLTLPVWRFGIGGTMDLGAVRFAVPASFVGRGRNG